MTRPAKLIALACAVGVAAAMAQHGRAAEAYPQKPIRLVIPYAAGGPTDLVARVVGQQLSERWGQQLILDNRGGANGLIAMELAAKAASDGYTLLLGGPGVLTSNPALYSRLPYNAQKDYAPIIFTAAGPFLLASHPGSGVKTVTDLINLARAKPGQVPFGSGGGLADLAGELFNYRAGTKTLRIPYKGAAPSMADLMGGQVTYIFTSVTAALGNIKSGKLVGVGVTTRKRWPALPDVPAIAESLPSYDEVQVWYGFLAPARTGRPLIDKLNTEINRIIRMPEVAQRFDAIGQAGMGGTPEDFGKRIAQEIALWTNLAKEANLKAE